MIAEDFAIKKDDDGVEFITFSEGPTNTRQGDLRVKTSASYSQDVRYRRGGLSFCLSST